MQQVVSIQSAVAYGYAGNSVVSFVLRRMGIEAWPVYTVNFSNHTGYDTVHGVAFDDEHVSDVVAGIDERGALATSAAVLTGYMGSAKMSDALLAAVDLTRRRNPEAIYCCDPVMGDYDKGMYTEAGVASAIRTNVVAHANILIPNTFELDYIAGYQAKKLDDVLQQMADVRDKGPKLVLTTSVIDPEQPQNMNMILASEDATWQVSTPTIDRAFVGSGDLTSAIFLANYLSHPEDLQQVLSNTASAVYSVLKITDELDRDELALVHAQDHFLAPEHRFTAVAI